MTAHDRKARRRQRAAERADRRAAVRRKHARSDSQAPGFTFTRFGLPGARPAHQASTAHVQAAYPAMVEAGLGSDGVYIGRDAYGAPFVYDPWALYDAGVINDANVIVLGRLGQGKSALSKAYVFRQRLFGRVAEFIDPKGEYADLVARMGGRTLRLEPGGRVQLNPLTPIGTREMREGLLEAVTRAMLGRPLTQAEAVGLAASLAAADRALAGRAETCVPHVIEQLQAPPVEVQEALVMHEHETLEALRECALALRRLSEGPLRGMFDAPTSEGEDVWDAPAVCLDLSGLSAGRQGSDLALGIAMVCGAAFLDAKRNERRAHAERAGRTPAKVIRVNDESWRALSVPGLGDYYQAAFKLSRATGVQHWLVIHRFSDLRAAGDEGSRQQRLAEGLLADAATIIVYKQHAREIPATAELLGLSDTEAAIIGERLDRGQALWRVGQRAFVVTHQLSEIEEEIVDTDQRMRVDDVDDDREHDDVDEHRPSVRTARAILADTDESVGSVELS